MAYKKILVDNIICSRRFHIAFVDEGEAQQEVALECQHCGAKIFERKNHPKAKLIRDENLVNYLQVSPHRTENCQFTDQFPPKSE